MSDVWTRWQGHVIDAKFPLARYLGSPGYSVVYLTELPDAPSKRAAIKLIPAEEINVEDQLAFWKQAAQLAHSSLLGVLDSGRGTLGDTPVLYVVTELADENLGEILPQRALEPEEAKLMLEPILQALMFLHGKGFVHGHVKPSNILALGETIKLSADTLVPAGYQRSLYRNRDNYDAPEFPGAPAAAAQDLWSLGVTLHEALTQTLPPDGPLDSALLERLPQPAREIVAHTLIQDASQRWSAAQVAAQLSPAPQPLAATASAAMTPSAATTDIPAVKLPGSPSAPSSETVLEPVPAATAAGIAATAPAQAPVAPVSPLSVPLAKERAVPLSKLPSKADRPAPQRETSPARPREFVIPDYAIPLVLGAAVVLGLILALPKLFRYRDAAKPVATAASSALANQSAQPASSDANKMSPATPENVQSATGSTTSSRKSASRASANVEPTLDNSPAVLRSEPVTPHPKAAGDVQGRGDVLSEVLPQAPEKALASIQGTVRVTMIVQVDRAGNVTAAGFENPGPSKYFASISEQAAGKWKFISAEVSGQSVPSEWRIRFEFSPAGVHAYPQQTAP